MMKRAALLVFLAGCGTVDGSPGLDGGAQAADAVACPTEDYAIPGGAGNPLCRSADLYSMASTGDRNGACVTTGTCSQPAVICSGAHILAGGGGVVDGVCVYNGTRTFVDEAGDCSITCQISGVATYSNLQANAGAPTSNSSAP